MEVGDDMVRSIYLRKNGLANMRKVKIKTARSDRRMGFSIIDWLDPNNPIMYLLEIDTSFP